jgi:hypothetical protein
MGLVRNLRKMLTNWAERTLVELSYHYIKQRAKQTTKRQDNFSSIMSSSNHLTTENPHTTIVTSYQDTSEKIIMETQIESEPVAQVRDWAVRKIELLHEADRHKNAEALLAEFDEWINIPEGTEEIDYLCIEEEGWGEQDMDVIEPNT